MIKYLILRTFYFFGKRKLSNLKYNIYSHLFSKLDFENTLPLNYDEFKSSWVNIDKGFISHSTKNGGLKVFNNVYIDEIGLIFSNFKIHYESLRYKVWYEKYNINYLLHVFKTKKQLNLSDDLIVIHDSNSTKNYFHWFIDSLPKLFLIKDIKAKVLVPANSPKFVKESILSFGFEIIEIDSNSYLHCKKLYYVDFITDSGYYNPFVQKMANEIKSNLNIIDVVNKHIVFISRSKSTFRSLDNEIELINYLEKINAKIIFTENLNWKQQVELFSNTKILISTHGAGLTNQIYMPKDSVIIEIGAKEFYKPDPLCFWVMASYLKHKYYFIPANLNKDLNFVYTNEIKDKINKIIKFEND
jgi:hypothetical protein